MVYISSAIPTTLKRWGKDGGEKLDSQLPGCTTFNPAGTASCSVSNENATSVFSVEYTVSHYCLKSTKYTSTTDPRNNYYKYCTMIICLMQSCNNRHHQFIDKITEGRFSTYKVYSIVTTSY